jgi:hypothetical protein
MTSRGLGRRLAAWLAAGAAVAGLAVAAGAGNAARLAPSVEGTAIKVPDGGDLQQALDRARAGETILLAPGATYVGNFVLPRKDGDSFITVRTDTPGREGTRIGPDASGRLARLRSPDTRPALTTARGAHHWRLQDLEFLANRNGSGEIIRLGVGGQTADEVPKEIVLERLLIRGDPTAGQRRGIALNSAATTIRDSYISGIGARGQDSQAICGWNGPGPFLIENNFLEAAAENIMFGGADPSADGLVPGDIVIRGNHLSKPPEWRQGPWVVKNLLELKNARRVLIENNVMERTWRSGQSGTAILFTVRNQDGRAPWSVVEDVTFQYNIVRHAGSGFSILGRDYNRPSERSNRLRIRHNLFYDIDGRKWGGSGRFVLMGGAPRDIVFDHNTVVQTGAAVYVHGLAKDPSLVVPGFAFTNNIVMHGDYGLIGEKGGGMGRPSIERYFPGGVVERNVLAGGNERHYGGENFFPSVADLMRAFVNPEEHDYRLRPDSPLRKRAPAGSSLGADIDEIMRRTAKVVDEDAVAAWRAGEGGRPPTTGK